MTMITHISFDRHGVAAVIPSISKEKYVDDCVGALQIPDFDDGLLQKLNALEDIATSVKY